MEDGRPRRLDKTYRKLLESRAIGIAIFDVKGRRLSANHTVAEILGYRLHELRPGPHWMNLIPAQWLSQSLRGREKGPANAIFAHHEAAFPHKTGKEVPLLISGGILEREVDGNHLLFAMVLDFTQHKEMEESLRAGYRQLTVQLAEAQEELSTRSSELQTARNQVMRLDRNLKKLNDAMKVLITDFQEQKHNLESRITDNFQLTIEPIIDKLRSFDLPQYQRHLLDTLDFSIRHITSYFGIAVDKGKRRLTSREVEICQMIRQGRDSREIARAVGLAYQTVIVHRKNIRKKLGIKKTKENLATFLRESVG